MNDDSPIGEISRHVWETKYRYREADGPEDENLAATWRRVAGALAGVESDRQGEWEERFYGALEDFKFIPGGRILAGAGTRYQVTLFNCFVMGVIEDSMTGIFDALKEGALTLQRGGGVGYDFSTLRPKGAPAQAAGNTASGPVSFMQIWDRMCATILSTGARRGAMMGTLRCDHPDIEEFVAAKADPQLLRHFNLSVLVTDAFMQAVDRDEDWALVFPAAGDAAARSEGPSGDAIAEASKVDRRPASQTPAMGSHLATQGTAPPAAGDGAEGGEIIEREWSGMRGPQPCRVHRRVHARELWNRIMRATYEYAEPGVIFIDRVNRANNLRYCETISATNPCGEIPLPPYGACDLGSINLPRFVTDPFGPGARLDLEEVAATVSVATRMLDNVYDLSQFPLSPQREVARGTRRIGLGLTGLGDALVMLGIPYGTEQSFRLAAEAMRVICVAAYRASVELAREKGPFPEFIAKDYLAALFVRALPQDVRDGIARHGIRNSHLTAIAPTGTISLLADNVSSGLEPVYQFSYLRRVRETDGSRWTFPVEDYAYRMFRQIRGADAPLPDAFVTAEQIPPLVHLRMQAALQGHVDNAISKTINVPEHASFEEFQSLYREAYGMGLKGCTTFRPNPVTGRVLLPLDEPSGPQQNAAVDFDSHCQPALGRCV